MGSGGAAGAPLDTLNHRQIDDALFDVQLGLKPFDQQIFAGWEELVEFGELENLSGVSGVELAYKRGQIHGLVLKTAYEKSLEAMEKRDFEALDFWVKIRDFLPSTKFSHPETEFTEFLIAFKASEASLEEVKKAYEIEILGSYAKLINIELDEAIEAGEKGFWQAAAHKMGLVQGYASVFGKNVPVNFSGAAAQDLAAMQSIKAQFKDFNPVELSTKQLKKRAGQMLNFIKLVPIEYGRGVKNGEVFMEIELSEAVTFMGGAIISFADLKPKLIEINKEKAQRLEPLLTELQKMLKSAVVREKVAEPKDIKAKAEEITTILEEILPEDWQDTKGADFELIYSILDQMEANYIAGEFAAAEMNRLEAYGIFDLGPELRLMAFNPPLIAEIDGRFWHGFEGERGLADLMAEKASEEEIGTAVGMMRKALREAQKSLGEDKGPWAVIVNSTIIVFREGLEAILIIFALVGSMALNRSTSEFRRPLVWGVIAGLLASVLTWIVAQKIIFSFIGFGEKLEAVISLIAIAVLLLITNWFFHNTYWNKWNINLQKKKIKLLMQAKDTVIEKRATLFGFFVLGLTSVYREGFETVLFLQVLVLDSGVSVVLQGLLYGSLLLALVGFITFKMQKSLPHLKMLIITGFFIVAILVIMVGQTVHTMQAVGWLSISPIHGLTLPYWAGLWLGLFATWETMFAQIAATIFVGGSYLAAEYLQKKWSGRKTSSIRKKLFG